MKENGAGAGTIYGTMQGTQSLRFRYFTGGLSFYSTGRYIVFVGARGLEQLTASLMQFTELFATKTQGN